MVVIVFASAYFFPLLNKQERADASVSIGSGYMFKTATTSQASATAGLVIRGGTGILGSIVIASSTDVRVRVYDNALATSTATSTIIADFPANTAAGTYTFDVNVLRGIVLDLPATYKGFFTITYR